MLKQSEVLVVMPTSIRKIFLQLAHALPKARSLSEALYSFLKLFFGSFYHLRDLLYSHSALVIDEGMELPIPENITHRRRRRHRRVIGVELYPN